MTDPRTNIGTNPPKSPDLSNFSNISSSTAQLVCNLNMAQRFLTHLDEGADQFTFQTFDDNAIRPGERRAHLAQIRHGTLEDLSKWLVEMNRSGAGIFVTVNETDGRGRKKDNIKKVRAVWQEDDGAGRELPLEPHIEIESSPRKYHRYVLTDGTDDWGAFDSVMASMVTAYGSDPNAKDRSRVMRLPGFYHLKDPSRPHMVNIIQESGALPLPWPDVVEAFTSTLLVSETTLNNHSGLDVRGKIAAITTAENYHGSLRDLAAHYVATGRSKEEAEMLLEQHMDSVPLKLRDDRWRQRGQLLESLVQSALDKGFGKRYEWSEPVGFGIEDGNESGPYPIDALPDAMRTAVEQVVSHVQAPSAMVASSAIASLSLAAQVYINVQRDSTLIGPASLFLMVIADSGERKSTCDRHFLAPIKDYEADERRRRQDDIKKYAAEMSGWDSKVQGVKHKITSLMKKGVSTEDAEKSLSVLMNERPEEPLIPRLLYSDATPEALAIGLAKGWPSGGVMSSEGGVVFGSHGMSSDSVMRTLAMQNELWDGGSIHYDRKTTESITVSNVRFSMFIQVQSATLNEFLNRSGDLFRGIGSFARFLVSHPDSTQGTRPYTEPPEDWHDVKNFQYQISKILGRDLPLDKSGQISPMTLKLDGEAKKAWVRFYNEVEEELADGGNFRDIRDVASKAADNCARLAALFQHLEDHQTDRIDAGYVIDAARIIRWHLSESLRFLGGSDRRHSLPILLDEWLIERCLSERSGKVLMSEVMQYGPNVLRKKRVLIDALEELEFMSRVRVISEGKKRIIELNPKLLAATANVAKDPRR
jgi:hypothetical protein